MAEPEDKVEPATLEGLLSKAAPERSVVVDVNGTRMSLRLRAMSGPDYDALERQHGPEASDIDRLGRPLLFNPRTFPPALVAACCVEPVLSEDEAKKLWLSPSWSKGDLDALFSAAYELNHRTEVDAVLKG